MEERRGMHVVVVAESSACIRCGLCGKTCPGWAHIEGRHEVFLSAEEPYEESFLGVAESEARYAGSSGGTVSAVLCHLLESGEVDAAVTVCFGSDDPTRTRAIVARTQADVFRGSGSKYQATTLAPALKEMLATPGRYAVVGLPCQIEAVRNACLHSPKFGSQVAMTIAIFCGHNATQQMTDNLLNRMGLAKDRVKAIDYRSGAWRGFGFSALDDAGREHAYAMNRPSPYRDLWEGMHFCPTACRLCPDFTGVFADISCGDAWLPELAHTDSGHSLILSRTSTGQRILDDTVSSGKLSLKSVDRSALWQSNGKQIIRKKLHLKVRLWIRRFLRPGSTPRLLAQQRSSLWFLPSIVLDGVWTCIVALAYRVNMMAAITPRLLTVTRNLRFWLERKQDRLANSARLLSGYTTETHEPEKQEAA